MCAQGSSLHTYHTENEIWNNQCHNIIYLLPNIVLQETKSITLEDTAAERHHNSTGNRLVAITHLEHHTKVL
jgi:hypothetical protein